MNAAKRITYLTPDEIDERAKELEADARQAQSGSARESILAEVARLRTYSSMKRWLTPRLALRK
jgi:hypothetical protein